jgi:2OG-Fe(II) oxygenase superfamily
MNAQADLSANSYINLTPGDPAPNPGYALDVVAGCHIVLCFYATSADAPGAFAIERVWANRKYFDDRCISFFGLSLDSRGAEGRMREPTPGIRFVLDSDWTMSRLYGSIPKDARHGTGPIKARRFWIVLDPQMRVLHVVPFVADGSDAATLFRLLDQLRPTVSVDASIHPPILFLPNIFEIDLCRHLISLYETHGGEESGVWDVVGGNAVPILNPARKRRRDHVIGDDPELIRQLQARIARRIFPEIQKAYSFKVTHIERFMISCYSSDEQGHFSAHRDNTTAATAHRRFAVSVNLNSEFEGGEISFPEYGSRRYKPPPGGAVIFSCALLHAVSQVTSGRRYAFLPFLYDEESAKPSCPMPNPVHPRHAS